LIRRHKRLGHHLSKVYLKELTKQEQKTNKEGKLQVQTLSKSEKEIIKYNKKEERIMKISVGLRACSKILPIGGMLLQTAFCSYEIGITYRKYHQGLISWDEFTEISSQKIISNSVAFATVSMGIKGGAAVGSAVGGGIGLLIGSIFGPGGTIIGGKIGSGVGFYAGGFIGGYGGYKLGNNVLKNHFENNNMAQLKRKQGVEYALAYFGFDNNDITDPKIFNKQSLRKKYLTRARECHPDNKITGSKKAFLQLQSQLGILEAILEERDSGNSRKHVKNIIKSITTN